MPSSSAASGETAGEERPPAPDYQGEIARDLAEDDARARLSALARLADAAAHEFNNMRATIEGTLELIRADPGAPVTGRRLERLRAASLRAGSLAAGLASLARLRRGGAEPLDIGTWLLGARASLAARLSSEIALTLEITPERVMARVPEESLRVVLRALLENAQTAIGSKGTIGIRLTASEGTAILALSDDGKGMAAEVASRACEPFFTTRPPAAGLGLTVARLFAREHGGTLELASAPGQGTTVRLLLPGATAG